MCTKQDCEDEIFVHPSDEPFCMRHLLMVLRDRQRKQCSCGQKIFLNNRDKCSRCSDPWIASTPEALDKASAIMASWKCEEKSIPEGVPHDC